MTLVFSKAWKNFEPLFQALEAASRRLQQRGFSLKFPACLMLSTAVPPPRQSQPS
jgi:hypothetical protein